MKKIILLLSVLLLAATLFACANDADTTTAPITSSAAPSTTTTASTTVATTATTTTASISITSTPITTAQMPESGTTPATTVSETSAMTAPVTTQAPATTQVPETEAPKDAFTDKSAKDMLNTLLESEKSSLTLVIEDLKPADKDAFKYHFFVDKTKAVKSATIAQPVIGTIPFFVGILKVDSEESAKTLADSIYDNVDYRKLICASYNKAYTRAVGDTVILILDGDEARAERIVTLFDSLTK